MVIKSHIEIRVLLDSYVYDQGIFMPKLENVKIPVAIKELSDSSSPGSDTELLEEARIMASVMHPCCIRIMAICVTRQMMLVTPLMPFGSLLDYLHRNRSNIGSRAMLTWAKQIAEVDANSSEILSEQE